jgi:ribosome-binding protein aMBF1 (putative translation factor)
MNEPRSVISWMEVRGTSREDLIRLSNLETRVVDAIIHGRYTPSPEQRQRLAAALQVTVDQIAWGHINPVEHVYGHGPQFGRSP